MFSVKSFSPVSFSITSFNLAQEDSARSGYWRLFYYNLQEEELTKNEQKQRKETAQGTIQGEKAKPLETKPRKPPEPTKEPELEIEPPVKIRPIYRKPAIITLPDYSELLNVFSSEYRVSLYQVEAFRIMLLAREADNDEEDIELLLLAA